MLLTVYKRPGERKTFQLPDDADLSKFCQWASDNNIWYTISRSEKLK